jgi:hypothetical protein
LEEVNEVWTIIKFNKKKLNSLKEDFSNKFGKDYKIYIPKLMCQKYRNNKIVKKEINLLGDYMFCFHSSFENTKIINTLNNLRGLKYFLTGFKDSQKEIMDFINQCKNSENKDGFLSYKFYNLKLNKSYRFFSGPFTNKIFKIIELQKNKIHILMGNLKTTVKKEDFLIQPV